VLRTSARPIKISGSYLKRRRVKGFAEMDFGGEESRPLSEEANLHFSIVAEEGTQL
jgi:hypothetical protein